MTTEIKNANIVHKIFHAVEAFLWRRGFHHSLVRHMLTAQVIFVILSLCVGLLILPWTVQGISFALGVVIFAPIFFGISGQVLGFSLTTAKDKQRGHLFLLLLSSSIRLIVAAFILYIAFVMLKASALVLVCGVTASMALALATFARIHFMRA